MQARHSVISLAALAKSIRWYSVANNMSAPSSRSFPLPKSQSWFEGSALASCSMILLPSPHRSAAVSLRSARSRSRSAASESRLSSPSVCLHRRSARRCLFVADRAQIVPTPSWKRRSSPDQRYPPQTSSPRLRLWMVLRLSPLLRRWLRRRPRLVSVRHQRRGRMWSRPNREQGRPGRGPNGFGRWRLRRLSMLNQNRRFEHFAINRLAAAAILRNLKSLPIALKRGGRRIVVGAAPTKGDGPAAGQRWR